MKLRKLLLPLSLFIIAPLSSCTPVDNGGEKGEGGEVTPSSDVLPDLTLLEVKAKVQETFSITLKEDEEYGAGYVASKTTDESLENAVKNAVKKIDYLKVVEDTKKHEEDYGGEKVIYYDAYLRNKAEDAELYISSFSDEDDGNTLVFQLYVPSKNSDKWEDINIEKYMPGFEGTIPAPEGATKFEYSCDPGYVEIYVYGIDAAAYANQLDNAGFVLDSSMASDDIYSIEDNDETFTMVIVDYKDEGMVMLMIMSLMEDFD